MTVAELLAASHRAHWLYQQNVPRMAATPGGTVSAIPGDAADARKYLLEASDMRAQAHAADPNHHDSAWSDEAIQFPHDELTRFYSQMIAR
jgi:LAS superfamily LD-carboxypeptidase LdcB